MSRKTIPRNLYLVYDVDGKAKLFSCRPEYSDVFASWYTCRRRGWVTCCPSLNMDSGGREAIYKVKLERVR